MLYIYQTIENDRELTLGALKVIAWHNWFSFPGDCSMRTGHL